jgi:hypothetical protein
MGCDKIADFRAHYRAPSNDVDETGAGTGRNGVSCAWPPQRRRRLDRKENW